MAGHPIHGQRIKVGWGRSQIETAVNSSNPINLPPCKNLWVGNLDLNITSEHQIVAEFSRYGQIEGIKTLPHKNCAFVHFFSLSSALNARDALQGKFINGRPIRINFGRVSFISLIN